MKPTEQIAALITARNAAKGAGNLVEADRISDELLASGISIVDCQSGSTKRKKASSAVERADEEAPIEQQKYCRNKFLPEILAWYEAEKEKREANAEFETWHRANPQRNAGDFLRKHPTYQRAEKTRMHAYALREPMFDAIATALREQV